MLHFMQIINLKWYNNNTYAQIKFYSFPFRKYILVAIVLILDMCTNIVH